MFIPLYSLVVFSCLPYHNVIERQQQQQVIVSQAMSLIGLGVMGVVMYCIYLLSQVYLSTMLT